MINMKAIILAGGKGTRLGRVTKIIPKPLVPVGDKPILERLFDNLRQNGVVDITLCVNYLSDLIESYFGDGTKFGIKLDYSKEDKELSTIGPLKLIKNLPDDFLVINGDTLTDLNFAELFDYHKRIGAIATIATHKKVVNIDLGVLEVDLETRRILDFDEKPDIYFEVSTGIYVFNRKILDYVPDGEFFGFDDLMYELLEKNEKVCSYHHSGLWLDIGRKDDYEEANKMFEEE